MIARFRKTLGACLALVFAAQLCGQDLHYSLAEFNPHWLNPGLTGAYEGTARVGGIYRDQWRGLVEDAYQSPTVYGDAPIAMLGKKGWLGVGAMIANDAAGNAKLVTRYIQGSAAIHRILSEGRGGSKTVLSFGVQGGVIQRSVNTTGAGIILNDEQDASIGGGGVGQGGSPDRLDGASVSGIDFAAGVSLGRQLDENRNFRIGASARHVSQPKFGLLTGEPIPATPPNPNPPTAPPGGRDDARRPVTIGVQAAYRQLLGSKLLIEPMAFAQTTAGFAEAQAQGMVGRYFGLDDKYLLKAGLGVRLPARFVYPMVGVEVGNLKVAASFDISANGLQQASGLQSAFEVGVSYIFKVYKEPVVEEVILCPQI